MKSIARLGQGVLCFGKARVVLVVMVLVCTPGVAAAAAGNQGGTPKSASAACSPQITSVGSFAAGPTQSAVITGSCFGADNTFSGTDSPYFRISILHSSQSASTEWHACYTGDGPADFVTCNVSAWADNAITFSGFTGEYAANGWVVNAGDELVIQVWNPQTGQGPGVCTVVAGAAGNPDCKCTPDYCTPADWNTQNVNTLTPGVEPLNVIISARSNLPLNIILGALSNWFMVSTGSPPSGCLSSEQAWVTGSSYAPQQQSWRLAGCQDGNTLSLTGKENHARVWNQPVPGSQFGAWFIAASYETLCVRTLWSGKLLPLQRPDGGWNIGWPWHCINGNPADSYGQNGYDNAARDLATTMVQAIQKNDLYAVMRTDTRPASTAIPAKTGENGVPFSGVVYVVTVGYAAPTP